MNIKVLKNQVIFDQFFLFIKENNCSIEDGLYCLSRSFVVKNSNILKKYPEIECFCTYTASLELFLFNFFEKIDFLKLKRANYKFLNNFLIFISKDALKNKDFLLFIAQYKNLSDIEYKLIFEAYPELIQLDNINKFHYKFWKTILTYQQLSLKFINKFQNKIDNQEFATILSSQKEFWNSDQRFISKILKIRGN